ncbi:glycoprotease family protein [Cystoisospora suis]|uniref:Glycoprotease family protein n=1 Tax=Cystoisospora suis TaxID=483139 RepID=A0A2C6L7L7_9APIC|nr:glycoprotease family protein [Cystoisospora suis]
MSDEGLKDTDDQQVKRGQEREEESLRGRQGEAGETRQKGLRRDANREFEIWRKNEQSRTQKEGVVYTPGGDYSSSQIPYIWLTPEEREALFFKIFGEKRKRSGDKDSILEEIKPLVVSINHLHGHVLSAWMNEENEILSQDAPFTPSSLSPSYSPSFHTASRSSSSPSFSSHPIPSQLSSFPSLSSCIAPPPQSSSREALSNFSFLSLYDFSYEPTQANRRTSLPVYQESFGTSHSSSCEREMEPRKLPFIVSLLVSGGHTFTSIIRPCQDVPHVHLIPKTFTLHFPLWGPWRHTKEMEELSGGERDERKESEKQGTEADGSTGGGDDQNGKEQTKGEEKDKQEIAEKTDLKKERIRGLRDEDHIGTGGKTASAKNSIDVEVWGSWTEKEEVYECRQGHSCVNGLQCTYTGQTEDDAAGEAIDKSMRTLLSMATPSHPLSQPTSLSFPASVTSTQREEGDQEGDGRVHAESKGRKKEEQDERRHLQGMNTSKTEEEEFGSCPGGALMEELGSKGDPTFLSLPKMLVYKPKSLNFR